MLYLMLIVTIFKTYVSYRARKEELLLQLCTVDSRPAPPLLLELSYCATGIALVIGTLQRS